MRIWAHVAYILIVFYRMMMPKYVFKISGFRLLGLIFALYTLTTDTPSFAQSTATPSTPTISAREAFQNIDSYVVYYGEGRLTDLAKFDAVIIQPETLTADELSFLKESDTLAIAYISIGELEPYREFFKNRVQDSWILGENTNWGSSYIDANQQGWHDLVIRAADDYLSKGFNGIFLDTVDTVDLFPNTKTGMIDLIQELRAAFPETILVQNRGFAILDETAKSVDGVMFEDLSTSYDFDAKTYGRIDPETNQAVIDQLTRLHEEAGLITLALDYAPSTDAETIEDALRIASDYGFIGSVSEIDLNSIFSLSDQSQ
jgi:uncharacterized protein (TIGR01370 family)